MEAEGGRVRARASKGAARLAAWWRRLLVMPNAIQSSDLRDAYVQSARGLMLIYTKTNC